MTRLPAAVFRLDACAGLWMRRARLGAGACEDGEAVVLEPAVGVGEAGFAHPVELIFDGGAAVVLLTVEGVGDLLRGGAGFADLLEPEGFVDGVEGGGGGGDLLGVH